jgi:hypothetical protein
MTREEINALAGNPPELIEQVIKFKAALNQQEALEQLQPETHGIFDTAKRPDKLVQKPNGQKDAEGNDSYDQTLQAVARIPLALQKRVVNTAATFLTGAPIDLVCQPEDDNQQKLFDMVYKTWADNKLDFKTRPIAKAMMGQKECAELWTLAPAEPGYWGELGNTKSELRMRFSILTPSGGNTFYPVYDKYGDMTAFGRGYTIQEGEKKQEHLDLYTAEMKYAYVKGESDWVLDTEETKPNVFGKIPVVYYSQTRTEWQDVQWAIERLETLLSNFADTNDYFGSPMVVVSGEVTGFATKGDSGKVLQATNGSKVEYLTWNHAPEAIKLEIETLLDQIYSLTQTPNITFREVKGLGSLSGIAIKLMFMDAHGKAKDKQDGDYGECIQRRINLLKTGCTKINVDLANVEGLSITPKFGLFMPSNEVEATELEGKKIDNLLRATGEKAIMSQQTAIEQNPLVENAADEYKLIQAQQADEQITLEI